MTQNAQQDKPDIRNRAKIFFKNLRSRKKSEQDVRAVGLVKKFINRCSRIFAESFSVVLTLLLVWFGSIAILMNRDNVDLAFFKPHYEQWFSSAFNGREADIKSYTARWIDNQRSIEVVAKDVDITGKDGAMQHVELVKGVFAVGENVLTRPNLTALTINGGALTIIRHEDGHFQLGLGTPETFEKVGALWSSEQLNQTAPNVLDTDSSQTRPPELIKDLSNINVVQGTVFLRDKLTGLDLDLVYIDADFSYDGEYLDLNGNGKVAARDELAPFDIRVKTTPDRRNFSSQISIEKLNPMYIAPPSGQFEILGNLDARVKAAFNMSYEEDKGFQDLNVEFAADAGKLKTGTTFKPFQKATINAEYHPEKQDVQISDLSIRSLALNVDAKGSIQNIGSPQDGFLRLPFDYKIDLGALRLNPGKKFDGPILIENGELQGQIDLENRIYSFDQLELDFGDFETNMSAKLIAEEGGSLNAILANGKITGEMSPEALLGFWPNQFALGARDWIRNAIKTAVLKNLEFVVAIDEQDLKSGRIPNDHVNLKFEVADANVQFMKRLPWLRNASGHGILQGNSADFYLAEGHVDELIINAGHVNIPRLAPKGGDFTIDLQGTGRADEMLRITNFPPFEFSKQFGINPADFQGNGEIDLKVTRPLLEFFDQNRIRYEVSGDFTNVALPVGIGAYKLNNGQLALTADRTGISLEGPIDIGEWRTQLNWDKKLGDGSGPANYALAGKIGRDELDSFGIGLRRHFGGDIDVKLSGIGDGVNVQQIRLDADLQDAELNFGALWNKQIDEAGKLAGLVTLDPTNGAKIEDFTLSSKGLDVAGAVSIGNDFKLENLDVTNAKIDGFIDAAVQAKPTSDGVLSMFLTGDYLNVEPWVDRAFQTQTSAVTAPIRLTASINTLALGENYKLSNASALFSHDGTATLQARLKGEAEKGPLIAEIASDVDTGIRNVHVEVPDAGRALVTLLSIDSISNGKLVIDGKLPPSGQSGGVNGNVRLTDFKLVRAPAFAQILSLASLTGLADTLGGAGLAFTELESKFGLEKGVFKVRDARASGPALGLTVEGDVGITNKVLDMDGVLVPSYTANSLLGDIPLIGDIVVGKKGEGVFALNYSIKGPFSSTQVTVNPLSALTPGFLRRIFDVKRDDIEDDAVKELIEEQRQEN